MNEWKALYFLLKLWITIKDMRKDCSYGCQLWPPVCSGVSCSYMGGGVLLLVQRLRMRGLKMGRVGWWKLGAKMHMRSSGGKSPPDYGERPFFGVWEQTPHHLPPYPYCLAPTVASMDASPALCAPATGWDVSWILMLLLAAGQGFTILALSIMLWRQRVQRAQCRGESLPPRGKKRACGCEAEGCLYTLFL